MDEVLFSDEQRTNNKYLPVVIGIILIIVLVFGTYMFLMNKPKNIFASAINRTYKEFKVGLNSIYDNKIAQLAKENVVISDIKLTLSSEANTENESLQAIFDIIDNLAFNMTYSRDIPNKKMALDVNAKLEDENLIDFHLYNENNNSYLYIEEVYDKYLELKGLDLSSIYEESNTEDIEYLVDKIKELLIDSLKDEYFEKGKVTIDINGEKVETTKSTFILTYTRIKDITLYIIENLRKDDKTIDALVNFNEQISDDIVTKGDIEKSLDDLIKEIKEDEYDDSITNEIHISVYVKGLFNEAVKYELTSINEDDTTVMSIEYLMYQNNDGYDVNQFIMENDEIETINLVIEKISDTKNKYRLTLNDDTGELIGIINWEVETETREVEVDKEYETKKKVTIALIDPDNNESTFGFNIDVNTKIGGKVEKISNIEMVDINELSEEEQAEITENLYMLMLKLIGQLMMVDSEEFLYY
ncbi:MAG: hypothetical protein ACOXZS_01085 [Bacilli bacterium]